MRKESKRGGHIMAVKICNTCGAPIKKLKHSALCQCGPKILIGLQASKTNK